MAPLPPNATTRYFVDYDTGDAEHTFQWRAPNTASDAVVDEAIADFLNTIKGFLYEGWRVIRVRRHAEGAIISLPVSMPQTEAIVGTIGNGQAPKVSRPLEHVWVGRSPTTGRRWELSMYGLGSAVRPDFRIENSGVGLFPQTTFAALSNAIDAGALIGIDGGEVQVYPYVNQNYNSYWEGRNRRG